MATEPTVQKFDAAAPRRVYKYALELRSGPQKVGLPELASILHVCAQETTPCIWAMVNPTSEPVERTFWVVATGKDITIPVRRYCGTVHIEWTVWHIFEEVEGH